MKYAIGSALTACIALSLTCLAEPTIRDVGNAMMRLEDGNPVQWEVDASAYKAAIHRDGSVKVTAGGSVLLEGCWLLQGKQVMLLGSLAKTAPNTIEMREGKPDVGDIDDLLDSIKDEAAPVLAAPELPGLRFEFRDDAIALTILDSKQAAEKPDKAPAYTLCLGLAQDAIGVSNLLLGVEDALPTRRTWSEHRFSFYSRLGNHWPDVRVVGATGGALEAREMDGLEAAGGPAALPAPVRARLARGALLWHGAKVGMTRDLVFQAPAAKTAAPLAPVPVVTATPARSHGVFPSAEPARFRLAFDARDTAYGKYRIDWKVVDHAQKPLLQNHAEFEFTKDAAAFDVDLVGADGPMGYGYAEATLRRADVPSARRLVTFEFGRCRFENDLLAEEGSQDQEAYWMNLFGFRGLRRNDSIESIWTRHHDKTNPDEIDWAAYRDALARDLAFDKRGTVRTTVILMEGSGADQVEAHFKKTRGETWGAARDEARARWIAEWAKVAGELGVHAFEPTNEPDLRMSQQAYLDNLLKPIYPAVKAGNPKANFLGGSCCGLEKHTWMRKLYELGGQEWFDGISFHPYTGAGFMRVYRMHIGQWFDLFKDFDDDPAQGIYMTESANHRGWGYNPYVYDALQARRETHAHTGVHMMLNAEAGGIPRDRVYVFYAHEHGYNDFYLMRRGSPTPSAIAFQVMNECLRDAAFVRELPLPGRDHFFQLYRDGERTAAALFTGGDTVELDVLTDAATVEITDIMGNRETRDAKDGRVRVAFDNFPVYLRVGPGQSLAPSYDGLAVRPNLALAALGAAVQVSTPNTDPKAKPAETLINGDWTGFIDGRWGEGKEGRNLFPDTLEITLPAPAAIDGVLLHHEYGGWTRVLRDFDVEVFADGAWKTVDRVRGNYYGDVTRHSFPPVVAARVRVIVHALNTSLFGRIEWIGRETSLRGIAVHAAPQRPAAVFFGDTRLAKPEAAPGATADLAFRVVNACAAPFQGELRLASPDGLAAEPVSVAIPAKGETTVTARVAVPAGAKPGVHTVVAGVYAGADLVSSDYEPRWIAVP